MKPFSDQTHYEILEVSRDASADQIERAYRIARSTYSADSLATYSVYDDKEVSALQERIELAYGVLRDDARRAAYDAKVSVSYLRSLEEENFGALPATVYVRGFVTAYARAIGLDAARVVPGYMQRVLAARPEKPARPVVRRAR